MTAVKRFVDSMGMKGVHNDAQPVQNLELSTALSPVSSHPVYGCGLVSAGGTVAPTGRSRRCPQSTALITRTIFHHHLVMSTMGERDHAIHV